METIIGTGLNELYSYQIQTDQGSGVVGKISQINEQIPSSKLQKAWQDIYTRKDSRPFL
jgi:hypothetical protein